MERNVPKLRFKGFSDEWKKEKLDKLGVFFKGNGISKADLSQQGKPCILYGELYTKYSEVIDKVYSKTNLNIKNPTLSKVNDVIIPSSGETSIDIATASCVQQNDILLGGDLNVFRPNKANGIFISYQLNSAQRREIAKIAQGASVVHVYNEQLKKVKVKLPSLQEQERIANFLTKVDKIIEKQEEKVKNLENYKKGMMQKIFSQEIRFKDENGNEYPEWEEKKLGDYIIEYTEKTVVNNQHPVLTSSRNGLMLQSEYFKDRQVTTEDNIGYFVLPYGYITYRSRSDDGIFVFNENKIIEKGIISYFYPVFTFSNKLNNYYGITYMNNYLKKDILKEIVGTSQLVLSINKLKKLKILLPIIEEQNKISNVLISIDNIVDKEKEKLEKLKKWKKGLLQQMFV